MNVDKYYHVKQLKLLFFFKQSLNNYQKTYFQDYFFSSPIIIINLLKYYQLILLLKLHLSTLDIQSKIHVLLQETYFLSSFLSCLLSNRFSNNNLSTSWYHVFITIHVHNRSHVQVHGVLCEITFTATMAWCYNL